MHSDTTVVKWLAKHAIIDNCFSLHCKASSAPDPVKCLLSSALPAKATQNEQASFMLPVHADREVCPGKIWNFTVCHQHPSMFALRA